MKKLIHGFLLLVFSCVPGCGQMYQGYMKRGISQTTLCCAAIFLTVLMQMGALALLIAPLWLYSFFDSYNLHRQLSDRGLSHLDQPQSDLYLFGMPEMDRKRLSALLAKRHSLIGWTLVLLGGYILYQTIAQSLLRWLWDFLPWTGWIYELFVWQVPKIACTLLIIALGVWFIRGPRKQPEDVPVFTPVPEEAPVYRPEFFEEAPHAPEISHGETEAHDEAG